MSRDPLASPHPESRAERHARTGPNAPAESLLERRTIQGRDITVLEAVYHVTEHFGMHTGQIILMTKLHAPGAIRFYDDAGGMATERWRDLIQR